MLPSKRVTRPDFARQEHRMVSPSTTLALLQDESMLVRVVVMNDICHKGTSAIDNVITLRSIVNISYYLVFCRAGTIRSSAVSIRI